MEVVNLDRYMRKSCPSCASKRVKSYGSRNNYNLSTCNACGLVFVANFISSNDLNEFYKGQSCEAYIDQDIELRTFYQKLLREILELGLNGDDVLDVGCGSGLFLEEIRKAGLSGTGIEPDPERVAFSRSRGLNVIQGILPCEELSCKTFNLIWISHVIEHVPEPNGLIEEVVKIMCPGALLAIITPNIKCLSSRILNVHHRYVIPPEHVSYYSMHSMRVLLTRHGLVREKTYTQGAQYTLKELIAYILKLQFLTRSALPCSEKPFIEGRGKGAKSAYNALVRVSNAFGPLLELFGGDCLVAFYRKPL